MQKILVAILATLAATLALTGALLAQSEQPQNPPATQPTTQPTTRPLSQKELLAKVMAQPRPASATTRKGHGPPVSQAPVLPPVPLDKNFSFSHPMTVFNSAELAEVKRRIAAHIEPQSTAFTKLLTDADSAQSFSPDPPTEMDLMGGYEKNSTEDTITRPWLWRNAHAAYASALAYAYSGNTKYADKAVQVLNIWSQKNTTFVGGDRGLNLGSYFTPMLYAADLLHDYPAWQSPDRDRFNNWWRKNCLPYCIEKMHEHPNNWKDHCILGCLAASVVLEDKTVMSDALAELQSYFQDRYDSTVTFKGAWKFQKDSRGTFLPAEVSRNQGISGCTYTAYSLTTMTQALEIARYAGHNFWHTQTPEHANLKDCIETFFQWDIQKQAFPWNHETLHNDNRKNFYELANNHYHLMPEITAWLHANRPVNGAQGDEYATLNKGNMPADDIDQSFATLPVTTASPAGSP